MALQIRGGKVNCNKLAWIKDKGQKTSTVSQKFFLASFVSVGQSEKLK